jgi:hypothetical protein
MDLIDGLAAARRAIDLIIEQGEGSPADREISHYRSFLIIQREYDALVAERPAFEPAWPVADNPVLRQPPEPEGKVFIDAPEAARQLDFACATYGLLLRVLVQAFARRGVDAEADQTVLAAAALELMHVLGSAAVSLAKLPASASAPGVNAGMTFTMLRGVEPLLAGTEERILREQFRALVNVAETLRAVPEEAVASLRKTAAEFRLHATRHDKN